MSGLGPLLFPSLLFVWCGAGLLSTARIASRSHPSEFVALSYLSGAGICGIMSLLLMAAGVRMSVPLLTGGMLLAGAAGIPEWRAWMRTVRRPRCSLAATGIFLLLLPAAVKPVLETQLLPLVGWDTRIIWGFKAKVIQEEGTIAVAAFEDPYRVHLHPAYPVLVPVLQAYSAGFGPASGDRSYRAVVAVGALAALLLVYGHLRRTGSSSTISLLATALLAYLPLWSSALDVVLLECLLGAIALAAGVMLLRLWREGDMAFLALGFFFCTLLVLSKHEGVVLLCVWALLAGTWLLSASRRRLKKAAVQSIPPAVSFLGLFAWWSLARGLPVVSTDDYVGFLVAGQFAQNLRELGAILFETAREIVSWRHWGLLLPLLCIAVLSRKETGSRVVFLLIALYSAAFVPVFVISPWRLVAAHVRIAYPRILLIVAPLAVAVVGEWIWEQLAPGPGVGTSHVGAEAPVERDEKENAGG